MELSSASSSAYRVGAAVSVNIKFTLVGNLSELKRCFTPYPLGFEETPPGSTSGRGVTLSEDKILNNATFKFLALNILSKYLYFLPEKLLTSMSGSFEIYICKDTNNKTLFLRIELE